MIDEKEIARLRKLTKRHDDELGHEFEIAASMPALLDEVERLRGSLGIAQRQNAETLRGLRDTIAAAAAKVNLARAEKAERERDEARAVIDVEHKVAQDAESTQVLAEEQTAAARNERDEARAQVAALRAIIEQHECAPCPGFDRGADGQERVRHIALATNAGRDMLDALAKAEGALRAARGPDVLNDSFARDRMLTVDAALAAIQALGIRGGA